MTQLKSIITSGYLMKFSVIIFFCVTLTGCAKQSFILKSETTDTSAKVETHHFFISGLNQKSKIDAAAVCGSADKVSRTETQLTFMNIFLNIITFGIYTPREATVYCSIENI